MHEVRSTTGIHLYLATREEKNEANAQKKRLCFERIRFYKSTISPIKTIKLHKSQGLCSREFDKYVQRNKVIVICLEQMSLLMALY